MTAQKEPAAVEPTPPPAEGTPSAPESGSAAPKRVLVGRYELGDLIGRGGMAEVHAAWDTRLGREVAVKVLRADLARDSSFLQRFRREAKSAAGLNHPGIVAVYDSGEDTTTELGGAELAVPFIVMELVHGRTLREVLHAQGGPLPLEQACGYMAATLRALAYSHANGIVHRDIKPANVMVTDEGEVKLTDFGIARAIADSAATLTNTSVVVGTAQYLSPEQAQGQPTDARSDVYAAGCVLYELLTGRPPFVGDSPLAIAYQHVGQLPEAPSMHVKALPREVDAVVLHALEKEPDLRYGGAGEMAADLEAVAAGRRPSDAAMSALPALPVLNEAAAEDAERLGHVPEAEDGDTSTLPAAAERPRRNSWLIGALAALSLIVLVLLGMLATQGHIGDSGGVTVPDVRNKTRQDAVDELSRLGFAADPFTVTNKAPKDTVVRQSPEAGQQAGAGSRVRIDVSSGPENVTIPVFSGYQVSVAETMLRERGLEPVITQEQSFEFSKDTVIDTDPKAGTAVKQGSTVTIRVSNGMVTVPDVVGKPESQAREAFVKLGLKMIPTYVDTGGAPGTVIASDFVGQSVPSGTEVRVTIVREQPRPMPTVTRTVTIPPAPAPAPAPAPTRVPTPTTTAPPPATTTSNPPTTPPTP